MLISMLLFAFAVSLDGVGVGLAYGMRKIRIACFSYIIICLSSAVAMAVSMTLGSMAAGFLKSNTANLLGAGILILIGAWIVMQNFVLNMMPESKEFQVKIMNMGIVISILKEPAQADFDHSGVIDIKEASILGLALAMDALGVGFGAAMSGYSIIWTPLVVALMKFTLVSCGLIVGKQYFCDKMKGEITLIPGGIIMLLGLTRLISP